MGEGIGVVVLAPSALADAFKTRFSDQLDKRMFIVETDSPHSIKLVNPNKEANQHLVWISSCT
jgi:hypothetical protein